MIFCCIAISSQRRKSRKAHFTAPSSVKRKIMSCKLSKDLRTKYNCRTIPVRKGDTVKILRGSSQYGGKGTDGKVICVYRKRWSIHVEKIVRDKRSGNTVQVPIHPSNCEVTQLKADKSRKTLLARKDRANQGGIQGADKMD